MAAGFGAIPGAYSWKRGVATFLLCFAIIGLSVPQLGRTVHVLIESEEATWVSRYYGQVALWPTGAITKPQHLLIVYDGVSVMRLPCKDHPTSAPVPGTGSASSVVRNTIVSFGESTHIYALESCSDASLGGRRVMHQITMLGANSRLQNVTVRCGPLAAGQNDTDNSVTTCMNLAFDTVLVNVNLELYNNSGHPISRQSIHRADSCSDVGKQLHSLTQLHLGTKEPLLTCFPRVGSHEMLQLLEDSRVIPIILKKKVPCSLRWLWYMPGILRSIHSRLAYIAEYIVTPYTGVAVAWLSDLSVTTTSYAIRKIGPYAMHRAEDARMVMTGVYCAAARAVNMTFCSTANKKYTSDRRYLLGVQIVNTTNDAVRFALDAVDIVPGLWTAFVFAWRLEWALTMYCLRAMKLVAVAVLVKILLPFVQVVDFTVRFLVATAVNIGPLLSEVVGLSRLSRALGNAAIYLWHLEVQWIIVESRMLWEQLCNLRTWAVTVLVLGFRGVGAIYGWISLGLGIYTTTTLSAHVFVTLIQTVLILVAMRNELLDIATRERERYPAFIKQYAGGAYVIMLMTFAKVHSVATFRYAGAHCTVLFMLIGLSVLPLLSKIYRITLYAGYPCISSYVCLEFFTKTPRRVDVIWLSLAKGVLIVLIDCTIGNFVRHLLREVALFFTGVLLLLGALWVRQRGLHFRFLNAQQPMLLQNTSSGGNNIGAVAGEQVALSEREEVPPVVGG
ncbi:hypothetical protein DQ04_01101130 [Trypanosoma grayi]|uniref:hypothetical protein n=1 Tax=Trypanosoma grayi TaxID=71804 RepID=UPI0004F48EF4|nr:hypothetical protein DQ04_01101130 [Trypanosoma grayi]KEG13292.1 hypothetical protein DQ04_01101130 [Trypanosoma grayi]